MGSTLKEAGHLDLPGGNQPPSRHPTSPSWGLTHWLVCEATESQAEMVEEPPVQGNGTESSEGGGREKKPRKGEVATPWPFPAQPVSQSFLPAAARRGWVNPGRGTMTWRETETREETEKDGDKHTDKRGDRETETEILRGRS